MKAMIKRFYEHGARGLFHHGNFSIADFCGNIEFQILKGNWPIICVRIIDGNAVIEKLSDEADKYIPTVREIVAEHHIVA